MRMVTGSAAMAPDEIPKARTRLRTKVKIRVMDVLSQTDTQTTKSHRAGPLAEAWNIATYWSREKAGPDRIIGPEKVTGELGPTHPRCGLPKPAVKILIG